ncbi:MAG TPA: hypothetical protein VGD08_08370 [Stellaceae bacterium]|jgi:hypothetical protein
MCRRRRFACVPLACAAAFSGLVGCAAGPDPAAVTPVAGQTVMPLGAGDTATATAAPAASAPGAAAPGVTSTPECREQRDYTTTVTIGGQPQEAHGTACLQADGTWRTIETAVAGGTQYTNTTVYHYSYPYYPNYPWYGGPFFGGSALFLFGGGGGHHHHFHGGHGGGRFHGGGGHFHGGGGGGHHH